MQGDTPVATNPSLSVRNPYQTAVLLYASPSCDVKYAAAEIYDRQSDGMYRVRRPQSDSLNAPVVVLFPGSTIDYSTSERIDAADFSRDSKPVIVSLDSTSDDPAIGSSVGTLKDSWGMKVGNFGFVVTDIVSVGTPRLVRVRPAGGGGSASLEIVQAMGDGSAGVVQTQTMTFKANVAASPNFDLSGSNVAANYFKL